MRVRQGTAQLHSDSKAEATDSLTASAAPVARRLVPTIASMDPSAEKEHRQKANGSRVSRFEAQAADPSLRGDSPQEEQHNKCEHRQQTPPEKAAQMQQKSSPPMNRHLSEEHDDDSHDIDDSASEASDLDEEDVEEEEEEEAAESEWQVYAPAMPWHNESCQAPSLQNNGFAITSGQLLSLLYHYLLCSTWLANWPHLEE